VATRKCKTLISAIKACICTSLGVASLP